jgi:CRISPR/Cas system CSM-associated protein Csm3 (group 7 of RAMP superfamily)
MADPIRGKLVWQGTGDKRIRRVVYPTKKGMSIPTPFDPDQLAASLQNRGEDEIEVDLEVVSGKPVRIRPVGEAFAAVRPQSPAGGQRREQQGTRRAQGGGRPEPQGQRQRADQKRPPDPAFHNPYNFVPAPPRAVNDPELGDREPAGHHRYHAECVSGVIRVTMTVKTPLLLPDAGQSEEFDRDLPERGIKKGHKYFPVRRDADGRPLVAPTGIKGMLRSAYEVVTNSRMAVFAGHTTRLQFRLWNPRTRSAPKVDYPLAPCDLLHDSLKPADRITHLSPADRVFGWVSQSGQGAYRGNVRVGPITCTSEDAVERFPGDGLPLAILGQPKEQQARFYVAGSAQGEAQADGISKEGAGYQQGKGLRGRKVYPHHAGLPGDHWQEPQNDQRYRDVAESGQAREYIRHPDACDGNRRPNRRDNQNRSIQGWVKPDTRFSFDLHVTNLSRVELGALLWLLKLPPDHFHRLGGGKPLGFGSVRLEIDPQPTKLTDGNGWREFYSSLESGGPANEDFSATQQEFEAAVKATYGTNILDAFLKMASGFADRLPTHYPRAQHPPHPEGRAYEWFVENDRTGAQGGPRVCLHDLATDPGLPMLPDLQQGN